jgi:nickel-dependent lactate racemase
MIDLPWGQTSLRLPLPSGWRVLGPYAPLPLEPAGEVEALCCTALSHPVGAAPLTTRNLRGRRVLLVADDVSRPTPVHRFFGPVRDTLLAAGARAEDVEILFALGVHRPMTEAEAQAKIGTDNLAPHRWHNHDAADPAGLVALGVTSRGTPVTLNRRLTEFDLIVTLGALEPHLLLGFSGGSKMLLPGCAGLDTIGRNHLQGTGEGRYNYVGVAPDESPMRLDLEEGVDFLKKEVFAVNAVLNAEGRVVRFYAGDPRQVVRAGAAFLREHAEASVSEEADVVVANSRPFDADLRQGMKCVGNTLFACRPGGVMLGFVRCAEGRGDVPVPSWTLPYNVLRGVVRVAARKRLLRWLTLAKPRDPIEQRFLSHFGLQMLKRNHVWVYSDRLEPDTGRKLGMLRQYDGVERMLADAVRVVGPRATVAVFPYGGATYARDNRR